MDFSSIEELTGNFPGWEYISLIAGAIFILLAAFLIISYIKSYKKNLFSYVTIGRLGLGLFFSVLAFFRIRYFLLYGDEGTYYSMIAGMIFSARSFMIVSMPLLLIFAVSLIAANVFLIIKEGFSLSNLYASAVALLIIAGSLGIVYIELHPLELMMSNELKNICYCLYCYFGCLFIAVVACTLIAGKRTPEYDKDYVMILGCKVRPDGTLYPLIRSRVERAMAFVKKQEENTGRKAIFVPSGGKGSDECIAEADAMKRFLVENGIEEDRILAENKSATTYENMLFSKKLIVDENANVAFSTSSFHVLRSGLLASKIGFKMDGMGGKTAWFYWPNAFAREFLGLLAASWKGQVIMISAVTAVAAGLARLLV